MSCEYIVTSNGELQIKPSNNIITFGEGDNSVILSDGQISAKQMTVSKGIKKSQTVRTKDVQQPNTIFVDVSDGDSVIDVTSSNDDVEYVSFTNVSAGETGYLTFTYSSTFSNTLQWVLQGGNVFSKNGHSSLSNILGATDVVHYYCVSSSMIVIDISAYSVVGSTILDNYVSSLYGTSSSIVTNVNTNMTMKIASYSSGTATIIFDVTTLSNDINTNGDIMAIAFKYNGITLSNVSNNPLSSTFNMVDVGDSRVAMLNISGTPIDISNMDNQILLSFSYSELYGPEPFALDGYYPMYYTSTAVDGVTLIETTQSWSTGDTGTYYMDTSGTYYQGTYNASRHHHITEIEILDSTYTKYTTNDTQHLYITVEPKTSNHPHYGLGSSNAFVINGAHDKELNLKKGCTYYFHMDSTYTSHPIYISTSSAGGGTNAFTDGVSVSTSTNTNSLTFSVPSSPSTSTLYYACGSHQYMGYKINLV